MNISRETTSRIRYILDNWVPPIVRDSYVFMYPIAWVAFGTHAPLFLNFRKNVHSYSPRKYADIYATVNPIFSRKTDLTRSCITRIEAQTVGEEVLEVGCGRGLLAGRISQRHKVTAVDIVVDGSVRKIPGITVRKAAIERLPFTNRSFDTVICTHTLEHVIDFQRALSELRRVTRKRLIIVVPMQRPYLYTLDLHVQFFPNPESFVTAASSGMGASYICVPIDGDIYFEEERGTAP